MADQTEIDTLNAQIRTLNDAIAGGEKQTVINGESVTYRSIAEMMAARDDIQMRLNTAAAVSAGLRRPSKVKLMTFRGREYNDVPVLLDGFRFRR